MSRKRETEREREGKKTRAWQMRETERASSSEEVRKRQTERETEKGGNERMEKAMYIIWVPDGSCVGPDMQKRGCRAELEYPRGLI